MPTDSQPKRAGTAEMLGNLAGVATIWRRAELDDLCAPRGALLYSPRSGHGLEEVSLDLMADP